MTAGLAFGSFDTSRNFGFVDIVFFLAVGTGDFHIKLIVPRFSVQGSGVQRFGIAVNPEPLNF